MNPTPTEVWRLFWAKTNRDNIHPDPNWTHPLWAHLIDVGSAAEVLWERFLPASLKQKMADGIGMNVPDAGRFLSIWIGLHDLGKAIPSFQGIETNGVFAAPTVVEKLAKAGLTIYKEANRLHHGHASIAIALRWLHPGIENSRGGVANYLLDALAACVGIHHGKLVQETCWVDVARDSYKNPKAVLGNAQWREAQQALAENVFNAWGASWPANRERLAQNPRRGEGWPDWLMAFAGWATLADWLGSMQDCFSTDTAPTDDLRTYLTSSRTSALAAYEKAGLGQQANLRPLPFDSHFGFEPRDLQKIARDLPLHKTQANLLIVEAPTGEGKTEAAFYLAARLKRGIYAAMPSQATSNGLFPRLIEFIKGDVEKGLAAAHDGPTAALRLIHGNDLLHEDALSLLLIDQKPPQLADNDDKASAGETESVGRVLSWFMPKKRALLVPYGVGTVDQLFLGVLYAKHFFLRLFALCGKTVVFDEVHAYDTYMNTIFERLLGWLRALEINVVVLSATLPAETRHRMFRAWGGNVPDLEPAPYPVAWQVAAGQTTPHAFLPDPERRQRVRIDWCNPDVGALADRAKQLLEDGATVIVICNTVERAQDVFELLDNDAILPPEDRLLLHARMPQAWRQKREKTALTRFGKGRPNKKGLLVGTQVIEQSLDLDADAMITDLAPIDLLLQRAGRLHRHQTRTNRPAGFANPVLLVACAEAETDDLPCVDALSGKGRIYARKLLWQTRDVLKRYGGWALPLGNETLPGYRQLIDEVYTDSFRFSETLTADARVRYDESDTTQTKEEREQEAEARKRLVPKPNELQKLFTYDDPELAEEDDVGNGQLPNHLRALTRNPDGLNAEVLLLHRTADGWSEQPNGETLIKRCKATYLTPKQLQAIFGAAVRIGHRGIVPTLFREPNPDWQKQQAQNRVLQRFQLVELIDYQTTIGKVNLLLDSRLGVRYPKE